MNRKNQFVFILGPHRSGTSLTAGLMHSLEVDLGNRFIQPNEDNPKGFFEDEDIVNFNDRLLRSMKLSWDSFGFLWEQDFNSDRFKPYYKAAITIISEKFSDTKVSGLKDPRFSLLLPFWKKVISEALDVEVNYVLGIREPAQCVRSQEVRHIRDSDFHLLGTRRQQSLLLWLTYLYKALKYIEPDHLMIVDYVSLVENPRIEFNRLAIFIGHDPSPLAIDHLCLNFVEPLLNRSKVTREIKPTQTPSLWDFAEAVYDRLLPLSKQDSIRREDISGVLEKLDVQALEPVYLQEMQYMYGHSYKKIITLRHRLLLAMQETKNESEKSGNLLTQCEMLNSQHQSLISEHESLISKYGSLISEHESLIGEHESLASENNLLAENYEILNSSQQIILNSRGWRLLSAIRPLYAWLFR